MIVYAQTHLTKAKEVDDEMSNLIQKTCSSPRVREQLLKDWRTDTQQEENVSNQVWLRHEQFLRRKKREDEDKNCNLLSTHTWEEQLELRRAKSQIRPFQTNIKTCTMFRAPSPWQQ